MSHDSIAKTIFLGFQWKIQNILYFKKNNQLIQNNFSKLFSGKWTVLGINIMEKKYVEWKLSLWVMIASQRQYSLCFSEKFKIYCIVKRITSLYKIILINYFQVKWTVLSINILEKKYVEWKLSLWIRIASQRQYSLDFSEKFKIYCILKRITSLYKIILVNYFQVNGRTLV